MSIRLEYVELKEERIMDGDQTRYSISNVISGTGLAVTALAAARLVLMSSGQQLISWGVFVAGLLLIGGGLKMAMGGDDVAAETKPRGPVSKADPKQVFLSYRDNSGQMQTKSVTVQSKANFHGKITVN